MRSYDKKLTLTFWAADVLAIAMLPPSRSDLLSCISPCIWQVPRNQVLVVSDDLDLAPGVIRLRAKGGHGGHNGMRSIIQHWGGQTDFPRLRIGTLDSPAFECLAVM